MTKQNEQLQKSRLGRLLVNRGYITEDQLDSALIAQAEQGKMLGEVLIDQGLITRKELQRTLKQQKRYRYTAAFVAMVAAPLQPMMAFAASPAPLPVNNAASSKLDQGSLNSAMMGKFGSMKMLDDEELSDVNAQGFGITPSIGMQFGQNADGVAAGFRHRYRDDEDIKEPEDEQIAYELADTVLTVAGVGPISNFIDADITITGLKFQEGRANVELLEDGGVKFYMPTEIERIAMENIRVKGDDSGASFGDIYISDVRYHPDSSYTIRPRN